MDAWTISIGVPVYNEENTLVNSLDSIVKSMRELKQNSSIILCFNGTTDNGRILAENYSKKIQPLEIITSTKGKPSAVKAIAQQSTSDIVIYVDADVIVNKYCFKNMVDSFSPKVMAVTGRPIPYSSDNLLYNIINARMINSGIEVSKKGGPKPFLHGRIYAIRKQILDEVNKNFSESIGDDTFLSHYLMLHYGRSSISCCKTATVQYQPVTSITSWWNKWSRIWKDLDILYKNNPEFLQIKEDMKTKIDWNNIPVHKIPFFLCERILHYSGKTYFNLIKQYKDIEWIRLEDTKQVKL